MSQNEFDIFSLSQFIDQITIDDDCIGIIREDRYTNSSKNRKIETYLRDNLNCGHTVFRGVSKRSYKLKPSIGRLSIPNWLTLPDFEKKLLNRFKSKTRALGSFLPTNEWEWLALAQHHSLPTRLMDWSFSPLIALYFATKPKFNSDLSVIEPDEDAVVYAVHFCSALDINNKTIDSVIANKKIQFYLPPYLSPRIQGQQGLFSLHPDPESELNIDNDDYSDLDLMKFIIKKDSISKIQKDLYLLGIRESNLFPDLDGYAKEISTEHNFAESHSE